MMTKKHFKAIAEIIKTSSDRRELAVRMSAYMNDQNPRFDREKFLSACGYD